MQYARPIVERRDNVKGLMGAASGQLSKSSAR